MIKTARIIAKYTVIVTGTPIPTNNHQIGNISFLNIIGVPTNTPVFFNDGFS
jgi:hypothetical protein